MQYQIVAITIYTLRFLDKRYIIREYYICCSNNNILIINFLVLNEIEKLDLAMRIS